MKYRMRVGDLRLRGCGRLGTVCPRNHTARDDLLRPNYGSRPVDLPNRPSEFLPASALMGSSCQCCDICLARSDRGNPAAATWSPKIIPALATSPISRVLIMPVYNLPFWRNPMKSTALILCTVLTLAAFA